MAEKKSSGCIVAAVIGIVALLAIGALVATLGYRGFHKGKELVKEQLAAERAERALEEAAAAAMEPVEMIEGEWPNYAGYQTGQALSREMFLAWRVDNGATTLVKETFGKKAEGAEVNWILRAGDVREEGDRISGNFYLPYMVHSKDGRRTKTGVESVRCEFAPGERESLLSIRRDQPAASRGRLSLKNNEIVLLDARQAGADVEKE